MSHPCMERLLLPEALDGRLEPAEERRVMAHLQTCPTCQDAAADIEIALTSMAVLRDQREHPELGTSPVAGPVVAAGATPVPAPVTAPVATPVPGPVTAPVATPVPITTKSRAKRRWPVRALAAAAAVGLLAGGAVIGHQLLPPRDPVTFGPAVALVPPATAPDQAPRGTVAVADQDGALMVRLNATSLPQTGWYECVWVAAGQSRSAGSFRAVNGVAQNVRLRVADPQGSASWNLQLVHHQGTASDVVLESTTGYQP